MRPELCERLTNLLGERVRFSFSLARHTSFRIGGPADAFAEPDTLDELQTLLALLSEESVPMFLLGGGTNILVSDKGVRGVVVKLGDGFNYVRWEESPRGCDGTRRSGEFIGTVCPRGGSEGLSRSGVC